MKIKNGDAVQILQTFFLALLAFMDSTPNSRGQAVRKKFSQSAFHRVAKMVA